MSRRFLFQKFSVLSGSMPNRPTSAQGGDVSAIHDALRRFSTVLPNYHGLPVSPPAHTASICPCWWGEEKWGSIDVCLIRHKCRSAIHVIAEVDTIARYAEAGAAPGQMLSKAVARALNLDFLELPTAADLISPASDLISPA
uniref:Uncharacterized protein n=1 Tax=Oryza nivara TaxID=4536 RepID=A0A0E0JB03_ORYNI